MDASTPNSLESVEHNGHRRAWLGPALLLTLWAILQFGMWKEHYRVEDLR